MFTAKHWHIRFACKPNKTFKVFRINTFASTFYFHIPGSWRKNKPKSTHSNHPFSNQSNWKSFDWTWFIFPRKWVIHAKRDKNFQNKSQSKIQELITKRKTLNGIWKIGQNQNLCWQIWNKPIEWHHHSQPFDKADWKIAPETIMHGRCRF